MMKKYGDRPFRPAIRRLPGLRKDRRRFLPQWKSRRWWPALSLPGLKARVAAKKHTHSNSFFIIFLEILCSRNESHCAVQVRGGEVTLVWYSLCFRASVAGFSLAVYTLSAMPVIICMLRGVNVGGHNKIKMDALKALCVC